MSSVWIAAAVAISFCVSALFGKWLVPFLHKINFGQTIRESGPSWHKKKNGTPIMGGFMFIVGIAAALLVCELIWRRLSGEDPNLMVMQVKILAGFFLALGCGFIGFIDDYIKAVKKRNLGLNVRQKLLLQFLVAGVYLYTLWHAGCGSRTLVPFAGSVD